jgi:hypothetical protein
MPALYLLLIVIPDINIVTFCPFLTHTLQETLLQVFHPVIVCYQQNLLWYKHFKKPAVGYNI